MHFIPRVASALLERYLKAFPVVALTGPRQSGKSTLMAHGLGPSWRSISMDDPRIRALFEEDPERFIDLYGDKVAFDEAQSTPELFPFLKRAVDRARKPGRFIVSGSSQFHLVARIAETLAGRVGLISLYPLQCAELPPALRKGSIWKGGYPEPALRRWRLSPAWYASYVETYLARDVRALVNVGDLSDFRKLLRLLAARTGQVLSYSELSRDLGVSVPTVKRWIQVLETSYVVFLVPAFHRNLGKRLVKSPRLYFVDTGLVSYLTGVETERQFLQGPLAGALYENWVVSEILRRERHAGRSSELYWFRENNGDEIDLILDRRKTREFFEIKLSQTPKPEFTRQLVKYARHADRCTLLYQGPDTELGGKIRARNAQAYLLEETKP